MSSVISIILFAFGAYAYVDDHTLDKMINRAVPEGDLLQHLDRTVVAKGEEKIEDRLANNPSYVREPPMRRGPGSGMEDGKPTNPIKAYKNGLMGANRIWGGYKEAGEIAKQIGEEFNPSSFFRAASPKIIDPELAAGEAGYFGNKGKFYQTDQEFNGKSNPNFQPPNPSVGDNANREISPKADRLNKPKALPFAQPNPFVQRGNPQRATLPVIRGPRAQTRR